MLQKKQNIPQDAAWKALQFTNDSLFYSFTFCFQNGQNSVRPIFDASKNRNFLVHDEFLFILLGLMSYVDSQIEVNRYAFQSQQYAMR